MLHVLTEARDVPQDPPSPLAPVWPVVWPIQLPIEPVCLVMLGLFNQMVSSLKIKIMTHDFFISFIALNSEFCTQQS